MAAHARHEEGWGRTVEEKENATEIVTEEEISTVKPKGMTLGT